MTSPTAIQPIAVTPAGHDLSHWADRRAAAECLEFPSQLLVLPRKEGS